MRFGKMYFITYW